MLFGNNKSKKSVLTIPLADKKGLRRMHPDDAERLLHDYMKNAGGSYEIRRGLAHPKGKESFLPLEILELVLHDSDKDKSGRIGRDLKKLFDWKSPFDGRGK